MLNLCGVGIGASSMGIGHSLPSTLAYTKTRAITGLPPGVWADFAYTQCPVLRSLETRFQECSKLDVVNNCGS
jgi:hypothetical protein